jgi:hypothetical protein
MFDELELFNEHGPSSAAASIVKSPPEGEIKRTRSIYGSFASTRCNLVSVPLGTRVKPLEP